MITEQMRGTLLDIEDVVRSPSFNRWREEFVEAHLDKFTYDEENRLEYTSIHRDYEEGVEAQIISGMPKDFDMSAFQRMLPEYLEGPGLKDEATGKAIQMLLETADFVQFREMMLFRRRQRDEKEGESKDSRNDMEGVTINSKQLHSVADESVDEMMQMVAALAEANADDNGDWVNVLQNDWMKIDKMVVPEAKRRKKSDIYLRGSWTMNLSVVEACDMMFTLSPRRKNWDSNFTSVTFPLGGSAADDEVVTSVKLSFGYLINLVMFGDGNGSQLVCKNVRRWNMPNSKSVTYALIPWLIKENKMDVNHSLLSLKTGTISPHPTNPSKIVMTTLEINGMGGMPKWALHWMMRAVAPSMMKGLEQRYIATSRAKGDVVDLTPKGFVQSSMQEGKESESESKSSHK